MSTAPYTYWSADDGDAEVTIDLPVKMEVCSDCGGHGTVLNASMRHHAYTREDFEETFCDAEDRAAYFTRGGMYDVQCPTCNGRNVVPVVDEDRLTHEERAAYALIVKQDNDRARWDAFDRATRRMESGEY